MVEFEYGEQYPESQIFDLIDRSIEYGTTKDLYDNIVLKMLTPSGVKSVLTYLFDFMDKNNIENYDVLDHISTKKISDIVKEHRSKKINDILE